jgi:hypothetical protein
MKKPIGYLVITVILLVGIISTIYHVAKKTPEEIKDDKENKESKKTQEETKTNNNTTYVPTPPPPIVKIGRVPTTHPFASNGCVTVWLEGGWVSYPQPLDTNIRFYDQQGRLVLEQGAKKGSASLPPADYEICRAPGSQATGVQIWN